MIRPPPKSPLFPYTTLSRSLRSAGRLSWPDQEARQEGHCLRWGFTVRACTRGRRVWSDMNFPATLGAFVAPWKQVDRKSTRLNSSHGYISYAVFCLKKKNKI